MDELTPKTHAEAVAVFRHGIIGALTQAEMDRGQLAKALEDLSKRVLPASVRVEGEDRQSRASRGRRPPCRHGLGAGGAARPVPGLSDAVARSV
jgi:hypothetical protein